MRVLKLLKLRTLILMLVVSSSMIVVSCKDDNNDSNNGVDKTALNALITDAEKLASDATSVDYPQTAIDTYKAALKNVKDASGGNRTQVEVNNLVTQLTEAMNTFKSKAYGFIDESKALVAGWHFDEGTGTTATAFSTDKHVATFKKGNATLFGTNAMDPSWVDGVKGKAIHLNNGAHLEVPYKTAFLPSNLTISVWIKPSELYENNYIVSQNFWNGYKLQTQGGGKPFFTYKKADGAIIDADNELDNSVKVNVWNHLVVTVDGTAKELKFYVNGILTKTWAGTDKGGIGPLTQTLTSPDPQPFLIGVAMVDALVGPTDSPATFGYFKGDIDELKIYNMPLSEGQISKLYTEEKP